MISERGNDISTKMYQHYSEVMLKRWDRLQGDLAWIYLDSHFVLTKWDRIWIAIKENMRLRVAVSGPYACLSHTSLNVPL
jgi:hypothetical protein